MHGSASLERIGAFVAAHRETLGTPGLAVALTDARAHLGTVVDGSADLERGIAVAAHHRFQIGSISKGFTALAILQQAEAGRIDLDAPVTAYLPWFEVRSRFGPITLHHLLSHTSGIVPGTDHTGEAASEVWSLRETHTGFAPGERFLYSNVGYKALGLVLEAVTGSPWWESVREDVMAPIGMGDADVIITDAGRERLAVGYASPFRDRPRLARHGWFPATWSESATADGTICATAEELTAYARLLLRAGEGVVTPSSFERMTRPVADAGPGERFAYGVRWLEEDGRRWLGHSGGMLGFSAHLLVDPEAEVGVCVLTNSAYGDAGRVARFALACAAAEASGRELPPVPAVRAVHHVDGPDAFAGTYRDELGVIEIAAEPDRLVLTISEGARRLRADLEPLDGDRFAVDDPDLEIHPIGFLRDDGIVTSAFWGSRWLRTDRVPASVRPDPAPGWHAFTGRYVSWNPWAPTFRVLLRRGELWISFTGETIDDGGERLLEPLPDGSFRVGDETSPDRISFDMVIDGRAHRATYDAAPFYRSSIDRPAPATGRRSTERTSVRRRGGTR